MSKHTIQLKGWQATIAIVLLLVFAVARFLSFDDLRNNKNLMKALNTHLISEYLTVENERLQSALQTKNKQESDALIESVISAKLQIDSVKGSFPAFNFSSSNTVVIEVQFSMKDSKQTRDHQTVYYKFKHSSLSNHWQYHYKTTKLSYYLNFL